MLCNEKMRARNAYGIRNLHLLGASVYSKFYGHGILLRISHSALMQFTYENKQLQFTKNNVTMNRIELHRLWHKRSDACLFFWPLIAWRLFSVRNLDSHSFGDANDEFKSNGRACSAVASFNLNWKTLEMYSMLVQYPIAKCVCRTLIITIITHTRFS